LSNRFNFYDFLAYIIPGSVVTVLLVYFIGSICGNPGFLFTYVTGLSGSIIFLVIGYMAGHIIQARGRQIELKEKDKWGGYFSVQFLRNDNNFYTASFKKLIKEKTKSQFGIPVDLKGAATEENRNKRYQEIFNLCYELILQKGISGRTNIQNAVYGMFRGAIAAREVAIFLASVASLRHLTFLVIYLYASKSAYYYEPEILNATISLLLLAFFLGTGSFLRARFKHFAQRFVDSVYRSFITYQLTK